MNRRSVIKSFFLYGVVAAAMGSIFEIIHLNKSVDKGYVRSREKLIGALAELIIPATDTPGALDAGVSAFIVHAVSDLLTVKDANNFIAGLRDIETFSEAKFNKAFMLCSKEEQKEVLLRVSHSGALSENHILHKVERKLRGASFFETLKELTVTGYCTSEIGATKALRYLFIPAIYNGCMPLENGQPAWATK